MHLLQCSIELVRWHELHQLINWELAIAIPMLVVSLYLQRYLLNHLHLPLDHLRYVIWWICRALDGTDILFAREHEFESRELHFHIKGRCANLDVPPSIPSKGQSSID